MQLADLGKYAVVSPSQIEEFEAHKVALAEQLRPAGALELLLANEAVHASWNLVRLRRLEQDFLHDTHTLVRIDDYRARSERAFQRALAELRKCQSTRAARATRLDEHEADALAPLAAPQAVERYRSVPNARIDDAELLDWAIDQALDAPAESGQD
jgi:hypothetical protein